MSFGEKKTLVQVYKITSVPEKGLPVEHFTPKGYRLVNIQVQTDCLYLTYHEIDVEEDDNYYQDRQG